MASKAASSCLARNRSTSCRSDWLASVAATIPRVRRRRKSLTFAVVMFAFHRRAPALHAVVPRGNAMWPTFQAGSFSKKVQQDAREDRRAGKSLWQATSAALESRRARDARAAVRLATNWQQHWPCDRNATTMRAGAASLQVVLN